ncbi:MAG: tol-pal system protein YbgF [Candidatus Glassbacteria bacterium RIFCSPLOWO2_12_FULL_58_11]|uniref:Tol-pal system protein YbgF n=1 Tax=Candidatus Glassbacteria bacterium RIFCSPLOWO2_12_FULL_58_11 TaxID=1817867 RepID=A0A1F5YWV5_9BACT|nr:MAG: tol-pal system protein YbgF [Candidatus Glassbacteria bacterium RIFCSPLOWO2_12_FULL_58_11]
MRDSMIERDLELSLFGRYLRLGLAAFLSVILASFSAGCGGAATEQMQILRSEVFSLKQDQRQLQHQVTALDSLLRSKVEGLGGFNADLNADLRSLKERLSIIEQRINDTDSRLVRLQSDLDSRKSSAAQDQAQDKSRPEKIAPQDVFDLAYKDYTSSNYQMAIEGFTDFLQRYPDSPSVAEAYFYSGGSYQALKKYEEAIKSYSVIAAKYPDSRLHPDALFRIGECLIKLGDKSRGETYYQAVIQKFPDSDAAAAARARLNP